MSLEQFTRADGSIDWKAWDANRVANGVLCYRCERTASFLTTPGHRKLCAACEQMDGPDEAESDDFIRCPKCGHQENISHWDGDYGDEKYTEGEHEVRCSECDHGYTIETHISYSYTSPARLREMP